MGTGTSKPSDPPPPPAPNQPSNKAPNKAPNSGTIASSITGMLEKKPAPEVQTAPAQNGVPTPGGGRRRKSKRVHWRHKTKRARRKSISSVRR
jgi:hypothetical protein